MKTLRSRVAALTCLTLAVAFALGWLFQTLLVRERIEDVARNDLSVRIDTVAYLIERDGLDSVSDDIVALGKALACRLSIISSSGRVLADSEASTSQLESHASRPEVLAAWASGSGRDVRYSRSLHISMMYVARLLSGDVPVVARAASPLSSLAGIVSSARTALFAALLGAGAVALALGFVLARHVTEPLRALARGAKSRSFISLPPFSLPPSEEIRDLANALSELEAGQERTLHDLEEERAYLERILASLPVGVLVVSRTGNVRYANPPLGQLLRASAQEGRPFAGIVRDPQLVDIIENALAGKDGACTVTLREREIRHLLARVVPVAGGAIAVIQDITERQQLEEARRAFVADAGHELQTPLTVIRSAAELLLEETPGEQGRTLAGRILEQEERMSALVDDLLLLSRLESERDLPIDLEERIDPADLARIASEEARLHPLAAKIEISCEAPDCSPLRGWRDGVLRAIRNLLDNAVKYTHERFGDSPGGRVTLRLQDGEFVNFVIEDNGVGVPEKMRERIFERFRRGDASRSRNGWGKGGYGLGLAIVRRVAELHGGAISVHDVSSAEEEALGSIFILTLPRRS